MLTEEQEKALLEELEQLRQDKAGFLTGTIPILAPEKSLWPDEREESSA